MKTSTIEVGDLLSPLGARGVEKQLARLPGVQRVEANCASGCTACTWDTMELKFAFTLASSPPMLPVLSTSSTMSGFGGMGGVDTVLVT